MRTSEILKHLNRAGFDSLAEWARRNGHSYKNVRVALHRWKGRRDSIPGGDAHKIIVDLSLTIGRPVSPALADLTRRLLSQQ